MSVNIVDIASHTSDARCKIVPVSATHKTTIVVVNRPIQNKKLNWWRQTVVCTGWLKIKYPTRQCAISSQPVVRF